MVLVSVSGFPSIDTNHVNLDTFFSANTAEADKM